MMVDPNERERAALGDAGARAGGYLDAIGETDLARLTPLQWGHFLLELCQGYEGAFGKPEAVNPDCAERAGRLAGEYLDSLGKTDLATLAKEEWETFLGVAVAAWKAEELQHAAEECPF
jgi:hypothetical protein